MIRGHVRLSDLALRQPAWAENLALANTRYLTAATVTGEGAAFYLVTERGRAGSLLDGLDGAHLDKARLAQLREALLNSSLQSLIVEAAFQGAPRLAVSRNHYAACPLYLYQKHGNVWFDWEATSLYSLLDGPDTIDRDECAAYLLGQLRYRPETVFRGLYMVPERGTLICNGRSVEIVRPPSIIFEATPLKPWVDPAAELYAMLRENITQWPFSPRQIGAELSSGLDTTLVAHALGDIIYPAKLATFGFWPSGDDAGAIQRRRAETVDRLQSQDVSASLETLFSEGDRLGPLLVWPGNGLISADTVGMAERASLAGIDLMFSGIGGDELGDISDAEQASLGLVLSPQQPAVSFLTDHAQRRYAGDLQRVWPNGPVSESVNGMASAIAPAYLRKGIWYAHPLGLAEIQSFAHFLPVEWRRNRRISREALLRLGVSMAFVAQQPIEDRSEADQRYVFNHVDIRNLFRESCLAEAGLIDPGKIGRLLEDRQLMASPDVGFRLHLACALELALQQSAGQRHVEPLRTMQNA